MIESLICLGIACVALLGVVVWKFLGAVQTVLRDADRDLER